MSVLALCFGVLFLSQLALIQAQPGGGEASGIDDLFSTNDSPKRKTPIDAETSRAQQVFREKFKGIVHVTHEIRVGNIKAHSQAGLALLIKKSSPEMGEMGMGGMGMEGARGPGGMGMGGMGGGYLVEYEIVGAKELLRPELRPELAELVQTLDSKQVSSRYVIRDLVTDAKMQSAFVNYVGKPDVVEKNGVSLLGLAMQNGTILSTKEADLDIQNQLEAKEQEIYEAPAKSYVPAITKEATIGSAVVSGNGGIGIAITRNGKVETLSGRELFNAYVDLLLLKKKQQMEDDPFGGSGPAVAINDKRKSKSNAADVASKSPPSSKSIADSDFAADNRSIDDALVLALTAYKQSKDKASKEAATLQLKQILRDQFDSLRAVRRAEMEDLRTRLDRLESDEKIKTNRRDEVIDERFKQLLR
jgi:hypothetical protein